MQVIGKFEPFFIILDNIDKTIVIAPIVVKNLSHDLNLGEAFLRGQKAELKFNNGTVSFKIGVDLWTHTRKLTYSDNLQSGLVQGLLNLQSHHGVQL